MSGINLVQVTDTALEREWLDFPKRLYKDCPYWVCPLDSDVLDVFRPGKNLLLADGEAVRWIARSSDGRTVGRIAAFYSMTQARSEEQLTGGCGFFECVDSQPVADLLFDAAREWLASHGMEAMDGPVNFGARDDWWGVLVNGFESQPLYKNPYNFPYYKDLFENYGFKAYFNQHTYLRRLEAGSLGKSVYDQAERLRATGEYEFRHIRRSDLKHLSDDFRSIYNKAWAKFSGVRQFTKEDTDRLFRTMRPIMDLRLIYFAYHNGEPIGFYIMIPDLNRVIGRFKGRFGIVNKLRLLWMMRTHKADRIFGLIFGVTPEFQGRGVESGIIQAFEKDVINGSGSGYRSLELAWIGDFNPVMMRMVETYVCAERFKMHTTYRYLFDREKEFRRCPRLTVRRD